MVGRVLNSVGGPSYTAACSQHTNIGTGDIATTIGGNLPCNYVIHAVCCHWNTRGEQVSNFPLIMVYCMAAGIFVRHSVNRLYHLPMPVSLNGVPYSRACVVFTCRMEPSMHE